MRVSAAETLGDILDPKPPGLEAVPDEDTASGRYPFRYGKRQPGGVSEIVRVGNEADRQAEDLNALTGPPKRLVELALAVQAIVTK